MTVRRKMIRIEMFICCYKYQIETLIFIKGKMFIFSNIDISSLRTYQSMDGQIYLSSVCFIVSLTSNLHVYDLYFIAGTGNSVLRWNITC